MVKLRGYSLIAVRRDSWKVIYKSKGRYPDEGGRGDSSFSRFELRTITSLELTQQTYREAFVFAVVHAEPPAREGWVLSVFAWDILHLKELQAHWVHFYM